MREDPRGSNRANIVSDLRTTSRRKEGEGNKERKSQSRGNGEMEQAQAADGARRDRPARLLNIIFSARENFSLFRSPTIVAAAAVVFSRGQAWDERGEEENFPFLHFRSYVPTACSRGARRAAPLLVLSFVNLDERSRLGSSPPLSPSFPFSFSPALSTTKSTPMRGLRDDALLPRRVRKTTR